jgi:hypothetical protein
MIFESLLFVVRMIYNNIILNVQVEVELEGQLLCFLDYFSSSYG